MSNSFDDQFDESQVPDQNEAGAEEYNQQGGGVSERRVSAEPVPSFGYYVLASMGATLAFEFDDKTRPIARHRFEVVKGPRGTIGLPVFADQRLYAPRENWTPEKDANGRAVMAPKSAEELKDSFKKFDDTQGRVQQAFGLAQRNPKNKTAVAQGEYISQFDAKDGQPPILVIAEVKRQTKNGFTKNVIWFDSIAGLNDKPLDAKYKTALAEAEAKIAAQDKLLDARDKKAGVKPGNAKATPQSASSQAID